MAGFANDEIKCSKLKMVPITLLVRPCGDLMLVNVMNTKCTLLKEGPQLHMLL